MFIWELDSFYSLSPPGIIMNPQNIPTEYETTIHLDDPALLAFAQNARNATQHMCHPVCEL